MLKQFNFRAAHRGSGAGGSVVIYAKELVGNPKDEILRMKSWSLSESLSYTLLVLEKVGIFEGIGDACCKQKTVNFKIPFIWGPFNIHRRRR